MSLRPLYLKDIIGQKNVIQKLNIIINSCTKQNKQLPHILLSGFPGLGKTSIAVAIANEIKQSIQIVNSSGIKHIKNILTYLSKVSQNSVLFIDEIHSLPKNIEEFLYPVMEDFKINLESVNINLNKFTIIGATTSIGSLSKPFYDRFVIKEILSLYTAEELKEIGIINCKKLKLNLSFDAINYISSISRGVPRVLNNYLEWCKHYSVNYNLSLVSLQDVQVAMKLSGVDNQGLNQDDRRYINILNKTFNGGPVGINALESATGISKNTILNVIEPYLLHKEIIIRTQKGRKLNAFRTRIIE